MTSLYSLRSTPKSGEWVVMTFDLDYEVESVYALSASECMCPAGHRPTCRHRKMLPLFLQHNHVDDGWFLDWDTRLWRNPIGARDQEAVRTITDPETEIAHSFESESSKSALNAPQAEPSPAPASLAPASPSVSRSAGAGAPPFKKRKITL